MTQVSAGKQGDCAALLHTLPRGWFISQACFQAIRSGHQTSKSLQADHDDSFAGMANAVASQILGSVLEIARQFSKQNIADGMCSKAAGLPGETWEDWVEEMGRIRLES